ncbi:3-oxoacid CoA-transferase subunit B [Numidum massiliense]|uniref:3-oxoacid CoA-transferase subunit B n=1 Tax=Numidum massiliense TaxID=1522315 RepID=UPI0006D544A7|nr:3-oxoacid CoA-transferase subunit B [Numidum massiliense]
MRIRIAKRAARELRAQQVVNLGVGIPTMIPDYLKQEQNVYLQSENGLLGIGPTPVEDAVDMDLISASKQPITKAVGASLFDSAFSFGMIRGGHIDVAVMGALQVSEAGKLANWAVPGENILGVGGAMDLVAGAKKLIVTMTHCTKTGAAKLVKQLTYPTSGVRAAEMVITEYAVFTFSVGQMVLTELAPEVTVEELRTMTEASFIVSERLQPLTVEE